MKAPNVFISYSHDSPEHRIEVLGLSNRLREDGVDAHLDWYEDSPPEGWPAWMQTQIRNATFVVVVCTEVYRRRAMGEEAAGRGLGVRWESGAITQAIFDSEGKNYKFIPVILRDSDRAAIPDYLRGATFYNVGESDGYEALLRHLTRQ
ncbi:MAG: SEFIR domain-containing protein, partial [Longimicrobiaceae bacterium]